MAILEHIELLDQRQYIYLPTPILFQKPMRRSEERAQYTTIYVKRRDTSTHVLINVWNISTMIYKKLASVVASGGYR